VLSALWLRRSPATTANIARPFQSFHFSEVLTESAHNRDVWNDNVITNVSLLSAVLAY
jgi:hypothetical protein